MNRPVILCVDDERIVLNSLKEQLKPLFDGHYRLETAEDGYEAWEVFQD